MALPISSLTVNDGAGTPVAQTFAIADRTGLTTVLRNSVSTLFRGAHVLTHEVKPAKTPKAANRVLISMQYPVEGTVDGQTVVLRSSLFRLECNYSPESPETERQTALGLFLNAVTQADVKSSAIKIVSLG